MTTTSARREQIVASLQDKEYRDLFVAEEIDTGLPLQIRAMRKARGWSQAELARRTGMTQEGISRLENLDYGRYALATLKRLAAAFDVALVVRFDPFSDLVDWAVNLSPEDMAVPDFGHDPGLAPTKAERKVPQRADDRSTIKQAKTPQVASSTGVADWVAFRRVITASTIPVAMPAD